MREFLANENVSRSAVELLRSHGHDVKWIAEDHPSIKDELVLLQASAENRIIITFDSDYGELIFAKGMTAPLGVIYLRLRGRDKAETARLILAYLAISDDAFDNRFTVLTRDGSRFKLL
jgi:predicted nuclease of predicted toxin-antitoxin system